MNWLDHNWGYAYIAGYTVQNIMTLALRKYGDGKRGHSLWMYDEYQPTNNLLVDPIGQWLLSLFWPLIWALVPSAFVVWAIGAKIGRLFWHLGQKSAAKEKRLAELQKEKDRLYEKYKHEIEA